MFSRAERSEQADEWASINQQIKRIGYDGRVTGHGFRHTFAIILHKDGFKTEYIELQFTTWIKQFSWHLQSCYLS
ncbi:hypothetical protein NUKP33_00010 [Klebsiella variicola]|nr:hypothetical protein NUKP33_00010 [Klebsiella variicola]GKK62125.1 hypothetical protein NUKP40_48040 [Klebsiella variicola]GKN77812.1 hypothetical protein NUKP88_06820 [Klebsiella variicola]